MRARRVDGLLAATTRFDPAAVAELERDGVPLVVINRRVVQAALPSARADDAKGARLAVAHLAELGHTRIAHVGGPQELCPARVRYEGYREGLAATGLSLDPALVRFGDGFTEPAGARACRGLLDSGAGATAILAGNDLMALGCYDALAERGVGCPDEVSVVGFNDTPLSDRFDPPLTTIRLPLYEIGASAAELLLERLRAPDAPLRQIVLEPRLVIRRSSGPARA
jgi:LacI family transcriptional regulator